VSDHLDCLHGPGRFSAIFDNGADTTGTGPLALARTHLDGLRDGDDLQSVGYPKEDGKTPGVAVFRKGKVVAVAYFERVSGGLRFKGSTYCPSF
jgi:hypothetical protein